MIERKRSGRSEHFVFCFFCSLSPPNRKSASASRSQQMQTLQSKLEMSVIDGGGGRKKRRESVLLLPTHEPRKKEATMRPGRYASIEVQRIAKKKNRNQKKSRAPGPNWSSRTAGRSGTQQPSCRGPL